jgi:hypothetical protein
MSLFRSNITVRITIEGCPVSGLHALEYRRENGLPERMDNRHDIAIQREISEEDFRRLVDTGWQYDLYADGTVCVERSGLQLRWCPHDHHGHRANIVVSPDDDDITLACRARQHCAEEQRQDEADRNRASAIEFIDIVERDVFTTYNFSVNEDTLDDDLCTKYREALAKNTKQVERREKAKQEAKRAEKQARTDYDNERAAWISEHGSPRLKRLAEEKLRHNETYLTERLAAERPGWSYHEDVCGEEKKIRDAESDALDALDEARQTAPDATLGWLSDSCHLDGCEHELGDELFEPGPALFADFLGHRIVRVV